MKAEINLENKAMLFALYYDQVVLFTCSFVKGSDLKNVMNGSDEVVYGQKAYLTLKPLSSISDEDAIEVYNILYPNTTYPDDYKIREAKSWLKDEFGICKTSHKWDCMTIQDFLRSKGYLVPWMGLSPEEIIEAGWAKYDEE